jgi:DNA-binding FadR family transcriptional regulator
MYEELAIISRKIAQGAISFCGLRGWPPARNHLRTLELGMSKAKAKSPFTAIETTSRSGLVEQRLREFIVNNKLVPGHRIPSESELSSELGVSRTAIREGLKSLEAVGVINAQHGKGRFVSKFDSGAIADNLAISLTVDRPSLQEILEIRKALETRFLSQAVGLLDEEDIEALDRLVLRMSLKVKEPTTFLQEDIEFHRILFRKLNNRVLLNILEIFWKLFGQVEEGTAHTAEQLTEAVNQHKAIVTALRKGRVSRAEHLLEVHFRDAERRIVASKMR